MVKLFVETREISFSSCVFVVIILSLLVLNIFDCLLINSVTMEADVQF